MPRIKIGDFSLNYESHGAGAPIVLIPGFCTGLWLWFKQVESLQKHFRVITFDPRGIGISDQVDGPVTARMIADDVVRLLESLNIGPAHILGASFGGFVAQEFALAYPQMTTSLILCCTSFGGPRHRLPSKEVLQAMATTSSLRTEERSRSNFLLAFSKDFISERPHDLEAVMSLRLSNPVSEEIHYAQLQAAGTFDAESRVDRIRAPTLILTGDDDNVVPAENSSNLAAKLPHATVKVFPRGSHMFFIENPEPFNSAVIEFIQALPNS